MKTLNRRDRENPTGVGLTDISMSKLKKIAKPAILVLLVSLFAFGILSAQSLQSRLDALKALQREAIEADSQGNYDRAIELARQIQLASDEIEQLVEVSRKWYILKNKLSVAKQVKADVYAKEDYDISVDYYNDGYDLISKNAMEDADYAIDEGLYYAELAIEKAQELYTQETNRSQEAVETGSKVVVERSSDGAYVVRLIPSRRDSLWRIAEYDFIYDDPFKWPMIYEANRDTIKDPDLIYPGQRLNIPALPNSPLAESMKAIEQEADQEEESDQEEEDENTLYEADANEEQASEAESTGTNN